ncbi:MAG: DNA-binding response regulator [Hyphomicrobiales bacterium]|nr:response regulator transcription factor [Hyphomicrobiales bacterium]PCH50884.1 MAG: DNA-binding response regulator [Hyphomicrobiales bacterium]PCH50981.1 MAG: DNA-binding response regulator [Hyphomicrobiales bacterium]
MQTLAFLIIDDHPLFREAMHSAVDSAYPNSKITETSSMSEALIALEINESFDLILLDLKIPDTVGFDGLLELRTSFPRLPIVVVSGHEDPEIIKNVISYGAAGFIPKSIRKNALTDAIKSVMNGEIFLPKGYRDPEPVVQLGDERKEILDKLLTLTPQQLRVITMIRNGLLNKQIAYELKVGETTVKAHVSEVLRKLGVNNRTQAAVKLSSLRSADFDELNGEFDSKG